MSKKILAGVFVLLVAAGWYFCFGWKRPEAELKTAEEPPLEDKDAGLEPPSVVTPPPADLTFNPGWIGAACKADADCNYEGGFCLLEEEGFPRGSCSALCQGSCPQRSGDLYRPAYCLPDPGYAGRHICFPGCNLHLTPSGCRPGYICTSVPRLGDLVPRLVCEPDRGGPFPPDECIARLEKLELVFTRPQIADLPLLDDGKKATWCRIDNPVLLSSPLHGVDFRHRGERFADHLLVDCRLALALEKLAQLLVAKGVVEVEHNGTFVCRKIRGTGTLSGHGRGLAIDITAFSTQLGEPKEIGKVWKERSSLGNWLRQLVQEIRQAKIFDKVLGPDTDGQHADHLHLELRL